MFQLFPENCLKAVDWSVFGFHQLDGRDSSIWLGTAGAYTPCYYDTYGCLLHAQIFGHKRWVLFPPENKLLQPSRCPYEESSVFSAVDVLRYVVYAPKMSKNMC